MEIAAGAEAKAPGQCVRQCQRVRRHSAAFDIRRTPAVRAPDAVI